MKIDVKIDYKAVQKRIKELPEIVAKEKQDMLKEAAKLVADQSKRDAPIDTGALIRSQHTYFKSISKYVARAMIVFGNARVNYALTQHEYFPAKRIKGKMKYLEDALFSNRKQIIDSISKAFKKAIGL